MVPVATGSSGGYSAVWLLLAFDITSGQERAGLLSRRTDGEIRDSKALNYGLAQRQTFHSLHSDLQFLSTPAQWPMNSLR